jgi:hypothetical protein
MKRTPSAIRISRFNDGILLLSVGLTLQYNHRDRRSQNCPDDVSVLIDKADAENGRAVPGEVNSWLQALNRKLQLSALQLSIADGMPQHVKKDQLSGTFGGNNASITLQTRALLIMLR